MYTDKLKFIFVFLAVLVLLLCSCGSAAQERREDNYTVKVMLRPEEGVSVEGDSILDVSSGHTATFRLKIEDGYTYIGNSAGAEYDSETGRLRLHDVYAPETIDIFAARDEDVIAFSVKSNNPAAAAYSDKSLLAYPGEVGVFAECPDYLTFEGWSEDGFLEDGGRLVSESLDDVVFVDSDLTLYANFKGFSEYRIIYNLCGGKTADGEDEYTALGSYNEIYAMQQTLESNGSFIKEGYTAVGYSLEPAEYENYRSANDIPGFSNMGGVCKVTGESLELNVVWAKNSPERDFIYDIESVPVIKDVFPGSLAQKTEMTEGAVIKAYVGTDTLAVIPEALDGKPVLAISSGAFESDTLERVVIPKSVVTVEKNAFSGCPELYETVIFDSVCEVYDESFPDTLKTVVLNAQRLPVYSGEVEGSFCVKYERLRTAGDNFIAVVSGSSSLNGLDGELFEELMPGYTVINYGTNAANPSLFFLEAISKYANKGDIVVHAPEYSSSASMGLNEFHAKVFRGNEQCYDIFRDVDISNYTHFWDCFRKFQIGDPGDNSLVPAMHQSGKPYQLPADINKYGDRSVPRKSVRGSFGGSTETFDKFRLNADNLNGIYKKYLESGAELLFSFGTFDKSRLSPSSAVQSEYDKFTEKCAQALDFPVISNIGTYIMDHQNFFDSEWHPNEEGARIRTENLVKDLKEYLLNGDPEKKGD